MLWGQGDRAIGELTEDIKLCKTKRQRQSIEDEIAELGRVRAMLVGVIGEPKRRAIAEGEAQKVPWLALTGSLVN